MSKLVESLPVDACEVCGRMITAVHDAGDGSILLTAVVTLIKHLAVGHGWDVDRIREGLGFDA